MRRLALSGALYDVHNEDIVRRSGWVAAYLTRLPWELRAHNYQKSLVLIFLLGVITDHLIKFVLWCNGFVVYFVVYVIKTKIKINRRSFLQRLRALVPLMRPFVAYFLLETLYGFNIICQA